MDVVLSKPYARILLVLGALACASAIAAVATRDWYAAHLAGTRNAADWKRAAEIEPDNATYWDRVGLYEQWDFLHGDINEAIEDLERATRLNPRSARLWMDLAGAYEAAGELNRARQAYQKAQAAHPVSADVAWRYGSFLLRQGNLADAAAKVQRALGDTPELTPSAISQFSKAGAGTELILDRVLPARVDVYLDAIDYFLEQKENDAAIACWQKLAGLGQYVRLRDSLELVNNLITADRFQDAARVWRQALAASGRTNPPGREQAGGSLIYNGGFESELVNGGFGWRQTPAAGTAFDLVSDVTHGGAQAARVVFDGSANVDYGNLLQYVALAPGTRYRFSAYMRTDSITTDTGPEFELVDCANPAQVAAETPAMTGTHPWTLVQSEFTTGSAQGCVMVVLRRKPSSLFANKISGTVWVDDVRLEQAAASGGGGE